MQAARSFQHSRSTEPVKGMLAPLVLRTLDGTCLTPSGVSTWPLTCSRYLTGEVYPLPDVTRRANERALRENAVVYSMSTSGLLLKVCVAPAYLARDRRRHSRIPTPPSASANNSVDSEGEAPGDALWTAPRSGTACSCRPSIETCRHMSA